MASIKKALSKVVSHARSGSRANSRDSALANGTSHPLMNGNAEKTTNSSVVVDDTNAKGETAATAQQMKEQRPSNGTARPLSFTEQKEDRKAEREAKEEEDARLRKERMLKAHEEVSTAPRRVPFITGPASAGMLKVTGPSAGDVEG